MKKYLLGPLIFVLMLFFMGGCTKENSDCTVYFNYDYLGNSAQVQVAVGAVIEPPQTIEQSGYQSAGWWIQENGEWRQWNFETDVVCEDMTLQHRWTPISSRVIFELNDGNKTEMEETFVYGHPYQVPCPMREGYIFDGWYRGGQRLADNGVWYGPEIIYYTASWTPYGKDATIMIGSYEQDNDANNGTERIEWMILDRSDDGRSYLLMSRYLIEVAEFHSDQRTVVPYKERDLHVWLNDTFMRTAFDVEEQTVIQNVYLSDVQTRAYVFLPSQDEVIKYLHDAQYMVGTPTAYVAAKGINPNHEASYAGYAAEPYWLRYASASSQYIETTVGELQYGSANDRVSGLRPAMWVDAAYVDALLSQQ